MGDIFAIRADAIGIEVAILETAFAC